MSWIFVRFLLFIETRQNPILLLMNTVQMSAYFDNPASENLHRTILNEMNEIITNRDYFRDTLFTSTSTEYTQFTPYIRSIINRISQFRMMFIVLIDEIIDPSSTNWFILLLSDNTDIFVGTHYNHRLMREYITGLTKVLEILSEWIQSSNLTSNSPLLPVLRNVSTVVRNYDNMRVCWLSPFVMLTRSSRRHFILCGYTPVAPYADNEVISGTSSLFTANVMQRAMEFVATV